jgi:nucleoid-associated protein YgaU
MADDKKKKGLFGKAIDAVTNRDEKQEMENLKEELAKAQKDAESAKKAIKTVMDKNVDTTKDKAKAEKEAKEAEERIKELEEKLAASKEKELAQKRQEVIEEHRQRRAAQKPELIATHTVASGETLSHLALKYYKHATPPYWQFLLEHNKEILNGSEKNVRTGMEIEIPELPEDLKD